MPSYEVVDLGIYKSFGKNVDMTVKINNVLDKLYYNSGTITLGLVNVQPGFPRSAQLTFRARL